jgi:hypothetical protein
MASSAPSAPEVGEQPSAAQKLLQQHQDHHATVEDVPDEDLKPAAAAGDGSAPSWAPTMSSKAAGKQKAAAPAAGLDTQSHELFPELGGAKKAASVVPTWGAKANGKTASGTNGANGASRASTPGSGVGTPSVSAQGIRPAISLPGRNVEHIILEQGQILPKDKLKRPLPDIIKDLNKKSRANVTMAAPTRGNIRFEATGPKDIAQQALKDLVAQIGARVCASVPMLAL